MIDLKKIPIVNWVAGLAVLVAMVWAGGQVYDWIYERGRVAQETATAALVAQLSEERDRAVEGHLSYRSEYLDWKSRTDAAQEQTEREYEQLVSSLTSELEELRNQEPEVITREIVKYIPAEVDGAVELPLGFVRLYSESLQGSAASDAYLGPISFGSAGNVGSPSGLTLSQFADIAVHNNLACVQDRKLVHAWQRWYVSAKTIYERGQRVHWDSVPSDTRPVTAVPILQE